jgi:hypothetical protein
VGIPPGSSRSEYHRARQASGLLLFLMVVGAALFSVDVPGIRKDR